MLKKTEILDFMIQSLIKKYNTNHPYVISFMKWTATCNNFALIKKVYNNLYNKE